VLSSILFAGGDVTPTVVEEPVVETKAWSFEVEPYLMVSNIDGDSKFGNLPTSDLNVDFGAILENLDMAAMVHVEAHHESAWGLWLDYGFMDLSNDVNIATLPGVSAAIDSVEVRQGVLEVFGLYRQTLSSGYIDYLAGIRWWDNNYDIYALGNHAVDRDIDWVDAVVGARYTHILNDNWKIRVHGDVGGGGADWTVSTSAGMVYSINDWIESDIKYKATWVDYEEGTVGTRDYFTYDTVTHGLVLGMNFKF